MYNEYSNDNDDFNVKDFDNNDDVENLEENTIIYEYNSRETLTSNNVDKKNDNSDETENINVVSSKRFDGKQSERKQWNKKFMKQIRKNNEQFTNADWCRKCIPPTTKKNFKFRMNDGKLENVIENKIKEHYCGKMKHIYPYCCARLYKDELGKGEDKWKFCCKNGKMKLESNVKPPTELFELFTGTSELAKFF